MKKVWNSFLISFAMFSKIPVPRADWDKENMKYMICFFPAIGVIIGLLECMSNLTANEMYQEKGSGDHCVEEILAGIRHVKEQCRNLIIVTNEIFSDGMDYDEETRRYQKYLGEINVRMASMADLVAEVVYSIPLIHKGDLNEVFGR